LTKDQPKKKKSLIQRTLCGDQKSFDSIRGEKRLKYIKEQIARKKAKIEDIKERIRIKRQTDLGFES